MPPAAARAVAPEPTEVSADPSKSSDVVMVACKLPHGLILELIGAGNMLNPAPIGKRVVLKGANTLRADTRRAQGHFPYAVTPVDRSFWEEWLKRNKDMEFVTKGFVFAAPNARDAAAEGKEKQGERTGLEALATEGDPRVKHSRVGESNVETDPDSLKRAMAAPT